MTALADATVAAEDVLRLTQEGNHEAFAAIVEEYQALVFGIAYNFLPNRAVAEEIAQDVFLQLYRSVGAIHSRSHLLYWLRQVTSRKCIDTLRRRGAKEVSLDEFDLAVTQQLIDPWIARQLRRLIAALPDMQRLILTLRYQEELGPAEIGRLVGIPENTVKSYLHRALVALRRGLGGNDEH